MLFRSPEAEVDPVYLDASYYVGPERAGEKPYTLLYEALRRTAQAALAQLTMHNREHLVLLRPRRFGLMLHTLFYRDEIRPAGGIAFGEVVSSARVKRLLSLVPPVVI